MPTQNDSDGKTTSGGEPENDNNNNNSKLDPIVQTACDIAVSSVYGESSSYRPIGPSADTAFSGSAVLELEVTTKNVSGIQKVVLKHSSIRSLNPLFETNEGREKNAKKHAAAIKTDKSSRNECAFLQAYSEQLMTKTFNNTRIPKVLFARDHPTEGVTLLLESLTSFGANGSSFRLEEIPLGPCLDATLEWLANFHVAFLPQSLNPKAFEAALPSDDRSTIEPNNSTFLWTVGTHLSLEKRSSVELEDLPRELAAFVERFQNEHDYFRSKPAAKKQGQRIQAVAKGVASRLHPDNNPTRRTMVHGDYKQGNMFFDNDKVTISGNDCGGDKIAVFDWQWTGPGIGATDLIYLCVMAVSNEALVDYETTILKPYHNYLQQAIRKTSNGDETTKASQYPYETLVEEFKLAAIDIQRWLGGSRYKSMTPESVSKAQQNIDVNHGIFRRSIERLVWIFQTVDGALDDIESGKTKLATL